MSPSLYVCTHTPSPHCLVSPCPLPFSLSPWPRSALPTSPHSALPPAPHCPALPPNRSLSLRLPHLPAPLCRSPSAIDLLSRIVLSPSSHPPPRPPSPPLPITFILPSNPQPHHPLAPPTTLPLSPHLPILSSLSLSAPNFPFSHSPSSLCTSTILLFSTTPSPCSPPALLKHPLCSPSFPRGHLYAPVCRHKSSYSLFPTKPGGPFLFPFFFFFILFFFYFLFLPRPPFPQRMLSLHSPLLYSSQRTQSHALSSSAELSHRGASAHLCPTVCDSQDTAQRD